MIKTKEVTCTIDREHVRILTHNGDDEISPRIVILLGPASMGMCPADARAFALALTKAADLADDKAL